MKKKSTINSQIRECNRYIKLCKIELDIWQKRIDRLEKIINNLKKKSLVD
jgi:hypothetical protein